MIEKELKEDGSKFIQLYVKDEPYLIFAPARRGYYHGFMLENVLNKLRLDFETFKDTGLRSEIPLKEGVNYRIVGAGRASSFSGDNKKFYDSSSSYGLGPNLKHLEEIFKDKKPRIEINRGEIFVYFHGSGDFEEENESWEVGGL